jgi:hypothetical protein
MEEEIKKLLEKNLELTRATYSMVKDIRSYVRWQKFWGWFKFLIIVAPTILAIIYLSPLINNVIKQYQELLGGNSTSTVNSLLKGSSAVDTNSLPAGLQKYLK